MWTYYKLTYANDDWSLFREDADGVEQRFNRVEGWRPTQQLWAAKSKGEIGSDDIIGEDEALALIASVKKSDA